MRTIAARIALALVAFPLAACAVTPDQGPDQGEKGSQTASDDLWRDFAASPPPQLPYPPPNATYCGFNPPAEKLGAHHCSATYDPAALYDAQAVALGCSRPIVVTNPFPSYIGILRATLMLCRDDATTATAVSRNHWGFARDLCAPCIPRAPAGQVWVVLNEASGPGCPSGCGHYIVYP